MRQPKNLGQPSRDIDHLTESGVYDFRGVGPVPYQSALQRDFLVRIETDPQVLDVAFHPFSVDWMDAQGLLQTYQPDYRVIYRAYPYLYRAPILVDIKTREAFLKNRLSWKPKFRAAMRHSKDVGYIFHLMTTERIHDQRWRNAEFLQRYQSMDFCPQESDRIIHTLGQMGTATFDHLLVRHFIGDIYRARGISHLWHLLAVGRIQCDWHQPFSPLMELWLHEW